MEVANLKKKDAINIFHEKETMQITFNFHKTWLECFPKTWVKRCENLSLQPVAKMTHLDPLIDGCEM